MTANNKKNNYEFIVDQRYGNSVVQKITTDKVHKYLHLLCECGESYVSEIHSFYIRKYKMCKICYRKSKYKDIDYINVTNVPNKKCNKILGTSQFGFLIPIKSFLNKKNKYIIYHQCLCLNCGNDRYIIGRDKLINSQNKNKSCGCIKKDYNKKHQNKTNNTHGLSNTPVYKYWKLLISQCKRNTVPFTIDPEWTNSLDKFISDVSLNEFQMHHKNYTIVPIDFNKPLSKDNYTWITKFNSKSIYKYNNHKKIKIKIKLLSNYLLGNN